ncbi:MAG: fused MFS/spermidine synthase [Bacteroidia bacterium]
MNFFKNKNFYFLLSFIEGGTVMAAELLGAKMLAPYFGSSLYVWATVLAITLGGLACGYFAGGILSYKSKNYFTLFFVLLIAAAFTVLMPFTSKLILWAVGMHRLIPAVIASAIVILFPPVFLMGMVSPLIIRAVTTSVDHAGKAAGAIYAISTVGGILATFIFGFYIIPNFGLTLPCIFIGILLGVIPLIVLLQQKKISETIGFVLLCIWAISASTANYKNLNSTVKVVYSAEGLLGQLLVVDYARYNKDTILPGHSRWLFVNRISQTMYDSLANKSKKENAYFTYVYCISDYLKSFPKNTKVLLLGLGGGSIANKLTQQGFSVDVCELDKRITEVAKRYFYLSDQVNVTEDDARHYIRTCKKKYDVIIFDTFKGEDPPNHVFTRESLEETKQLLAADGIIFVNSLGYIEGSIGKAMRSIYKTFEDTGYHVEVLSTDPDPNQRNLLFYASLKEIKPNVDFIDMKKIDLSDAVCLTDEYPILDVLNAEAAQRWRVMAIKNFGLNYQRGIPVFN